MCTPIFSKYRKYFHLQHLHYFEVGKKTNAPLFSLNPDPTPPHNSKLPWPRGPKFSELYFMITIHESREVPFLTMPKIRGPSKMNTCKFDVFIFLYEII